MNQNRLFTSIGILVVGAFAILVFGGYFFYNNYLRQERQTYVMFFKGSLEGLKTQSALTYRGVKIGEVIRIELTENRAKKTVEIPVYVQFFVAKGNLFDRNPVRLLIENGYIADISTPNLISGTSSIRLIQSDKKKYIYSSAYYNHYPIFPTIPILEKYTTLDETLKTAQETMKAIEEFVRSKEIKETIASIRDTSGQFDKLAGHLNQNITPTTAYINQSMEQITKSARSVQEFVDYLKRYPESLLRGRS